MATPVIMPRQGQSVESCIIGKWYKKKGEKVNEGDILFTYETDKATFDEAAKVSGIVLDIFFETGEDVPCLTNVCVIGAEGEDISAFQPSDTAGNSQTSAGSEKPTEASSEKASQPIEKADPITPILTQGADKISPRARNLAQKSHIDYRYAAPTGPNGRIIEQDIIALQNSGMVFTPAAQNMNLDGKMNPVSGTGLGGKITTEDLLNKSEASINTNSKPIQQIAAQIASEPQFEDVKLPNIRKVIAKAMHASLSNSAQLTLNASFDASSILEYRSMIKSQYANLAMENITINDMIVFAVSRTLLNHKALNAHYLDDTLRYFKNVNMGIAVDTERGLMVPTVINANLKSLNEISSEVKSLARECQAGTINPDNLKNGTFTISNLGTFDVESFTPVLNPPQTGILGVNTIGQKAKEVDGQLKLYPSMSLSLTFDHRALDGAPAARFLKDLKNNLEHFTVLLAR